MSWSSHLVVVFQCGERAALHDCANSTDAKYLEAGRFLAAMREYRKPGTRHLVTWGEACNHLDVEEFLQATKLFFTKMYEHDDGIADYEQVMIFHETEQRETCDAYQLLWNKTHGIKTHKIERLPFTWGVW